MSKEGKQLQVLNRLVGPDVEGNAAAAALHVGGDRLRGAARDALGTGVDEERAGGGRVPERESWKRNKSND